MLRSNTLYSQAPTSRLLLDWHTQLLLREESPQFSMKWLIRNFWPATFSLSILPRSRTKRNMVLNLIWHSGILTKPNSMETSTGMTFPSNTCSVLNSMMLKLTENLSVSAKLDQMVVSSHLILELPSCQFQPSLSNPWLHKKSQLHTLSLSAKVNKISAISLSSLVARIITSPQMNGCSIQSNYNWLKVDRKWNSKWVH